jgi:hypothetical protein
MRGHSSRSQSCVAPPATFQSDRDAYDGYACEMAVTGLGLLGDRRALPMLREIAAETNVGEILIAAREALARIEQDAAEAPSELEGLSAFQLEALAQSESTRPETLDLLSGYASIRVRTLAAMNPTTPEETLRALSRDHPELHANLLANPSCPSDVLVEIVGAGRVSNARYQAERHPNWMRER